MLPQAHVQMHVGLVDGHRDGFVRPGFVAGGVAEDEAQVGEVGGGGVDVYGVSVFGFVPPGGVSLVQEDGQVAFLEEPVQGVDDVFVVGVETVGGIEFEADGAPLVYCGGQYFEGVGPSGVDSAEGVEPAGVPLGGFGA